MSLASAAPDHLPPAGNVDSDDWLSQVKPELEARMAEYEDGEIEFAILGLVQDPLVLLVHDLACNVKGIQVLESRLDDIKPDWRSLHVPTTAEEAICAEHMLVGPYLHYRLDQATISDVPLRREIQSKTNTDSAMELLDLRRVLASEQRHLRASILDEQESDRKDEDKAAARRHDYGPAIRKWLLHLVRQDTFKPLVENRKKSRKVEAE